MTNSSTTGAVPPTVNFFISCVDSPEGSGDVGDDSGYPQRLKWQIQNKNLADAPIRGVEDKSYIKLHTCSLLPIVYV